MPKILYLAPAPLIPIKLTFPVFPAWLHFGHSQQFGSSSFTTPSDSFTWGETQPVTPVLHKQEGDDIPRHTAPCLLDGLQPSQGSRGTGLSQAEQALGAAQPPLDDAGGTLAKPSCDCTIPKPSHSSGLQSSVLCPREPRQGSPSVCSHTFIPWHF